MQDAAYPPVIATIGLHGSASTWVFNIVRELVIAVAGEEAVLPVYADAMQQLPPADEQVGRCLLIKSHHGSPQLDEWLAARQAGIIISVRDPRDAAISMSQRFNVPLSATVRWVGYDCARITPLAASGHAVVRYENRFFDDPGTVAEIGELFRLQVPSSVMTAVFDRYRTEKVKDFAGRLTDLASERITTGGLAMMDKVTQILASHIGDGRTGKWRDLPESAQSGLTRIFTPFLDQFGYPK